MADIRIIKSHKRSISMSFSAEGILIVRAPKLMPNFMIEQFITTHTDWIEKHEKQVHVRKRKKHSFINGEIFLYLGKEYTLKLGNYTSITIDGEHILFPHALVFRAEKELTNWYIKRAKEIITERLVWYAKELNASYKEVTFSDTKSQWGRCTRDNRLQFNWRLIMAPILTINYVVVHELVHTVEKNHSRAFWSHVRHFNPSYRQQIKWLKEYGDTLVM